MKPEDLLKHDIRIIDISNAPLAEYDPDNKMLSLGDGDQIILGRSSLKKQRLVSRSSMYFDNDKISAKHLEFLKNPKKFNLIVKNHSKHGFFHLSVDKKKAKYVSDEQEGYTFLKNGEYIAISSSKQFIHDYMHKFNKSPQSILKYCKILLKVMTNYETKLVVISNLDKNLGSGLEFQTVFPELAITRKQILSSQTFFGLNKESNACLETPDISLDEAAEQSERDCLFDISTNRFLNVDLDEEQDESDSDEENSDFGTILFDENDQVSSDNETNDIAGYSSNNLEECANNCYEDVSPNDLVFIHESNSSNYFSEVDTNEDEELKSIDSDSELDTSDKVVFTIPSIPVENMNKLRKRTSDTLYQEEYDDYDRALVKKQKREDELVVQVKLQEELLKDLQNTISLLKTKSGTSSYSGLKNNIKAAFLGASAGAIATFYTLYQIGSRMK